jgi:CDP-diacylglycerol--glycerol-3-phosphate 3-phosphatidyltransferase
MPYNLPNILTVARILMSFIALILATNSGLPDSEPTASDMLMRYIAYGLAILAGVTDLADGYLARKWNQVTDFGALMDPLADKVFVTVTMLFMVAFQLIPAWVAAIIICREFMVTGLRMLATKQGKVISADKFGKLKTLLQMIMLFVAGLVWMKILSMDKVLFCNVTVALLYNILLWAVVIVTVGSGANYFIKNRELIADKSKKS